MLRPFGRALGLGKWAQGLTPRHEGESRFADLGDKPGSKAFAKPHTLKLQDTKRMQEKWNEQSDLANPCFEKVPHRGI
jgi:hypothetical protein